jgi:hypothetical protein
MFLNIRSDWDNFPFDKQIGYSLSYGRNTMFSAILKITAILKTSKKTSQFILKWQNYFCEILLQKSLFLQWCLKKLKQKNFPIFKIYNLSKTRNFRKKKCGRFHLKCSCALMKMMDCGGKRLQELSESRRALQNSIQQ